MAEALARGIEVAPPQRFNDSGVMLSGKCHSAGVPEVGPHVPPGHLPKVGDHGQEPLVGTTLEQGTVPLLVERDTPVGVAPGGSKLAVNLSEPSQPLRRDRTGHRQGQTFEGGEYRAGFPHLRLVQRSDPEAPSHVGFDDPFPSEAEQSLADRRPAHSELSGNLGVPDAGTGGKIPTMDLLEQLPVDLVSERRSRDDISLLGW